MGRLEMSEHARKIVERERLAIEAEAVELCGKLQSPASALSAICKLLNVRGRYFAITGEHFSVQDYDGLMTVDALDECLVRAINKVSRSFLERERRTPGTQAVAVLADRFVHDVKELPKYPVAYRVLFLLRNALDVFESVADSSHGIELQELESAFVHHVLGVSDSYIQTRERNCMRHFSDVAREYDVVGRLKCKCGEDQFVVKLQSLKQVDGGTAYDCLDVECKACGHQRSLTFDLPFFGDLYKA